MNHTSMVTLRQKNSFVVEVAFKIYNEERFPFIILCEAKRMIFFEFFFNVLGTICGSFKIE